ncbi:hypothetical protein [Hymenobacter terrenus]|uniref:hypothetical protein n=1 Tax=Hymenobacter terrenus TaxID=1629124 RepID=UPI0012E0162F|nr:hypothetical protein [Hymenobacter terrenus]
MAIDYTILTDLAQCDAADADVTFELKTFAARDINADVADERADRSKTDITAQLSKVTGEISSLDYRLAEPGLDAKVLSDLTDEREALVVLRKKLTKCSQQVTGTNRFLAQVDVEQIAQQVALLTTVKAGIATRRAALSS